jgi:hypothetical protein
MCQITLSSRYDMLRAVIVGSVDTNMSEMPRDTCRKKMQYMRRERVSLLHTLSATADYLPVVEEIRGIITTSNPGTDRRKFSRVKWKTHCAAPD